MIWTLTGSLPPGLSLSASGVVNGVPTAAITGNFVVAVTDAALHTTMATLSLRIDLSWGSQIPIVTRRADLQSVSCPTSSFCAAVDAAGYVTTYDGKSWGNPAIVGSNVNLGSVSCASNTFCVATNDRAQGGVLTFDGSKWSGPALIDSVYLITLVSCPSSTFCAAVDGGGNAMLYDGTHWSAPAWVGTQSPTSLSCA